MSWKLTSFGAVSLPTHVLRREDAATPGSAALRPYRVETVNGPFDLLGTRRARGEAQRIPHRGYVVGDDAADLASNMADLEALWGTYAALRRTNRDGTEHWLYARLVQFQPTEIGTKTHQLVDMVFETTEPSWRGTQRVITGSGATATIALTNDGTAAVWDAVLEVSGTAVQQFDIDMTAESRRSKFQFNNLPSTYTRVVVDGGAFSVVDNSGVTALAGFGLNSAHNHEGWLFIPPGGGSASMGGTALVGTPTYKFTYYERWV